MAKQRFLNNFTSAFIAAVKDAPSSGTPETELDYGVLRISDGAAGSLINPTDGDYYLLTAFKRLGSVESNIEVMRVTGVNNATPGECRITVQRAQEGTSAKAFVAGDYLSLRITKGTAENFSQPADLATKEPVIAAPVSAPTEKYWRGDKTWRDFFTDVRAATLTGLSTATNAVVAATDTVLAAIGKLQAQVTDLGTSKQDKLVSGTNIKTVNGNSLMGSGDVAVGDVTLSGTQTLTNKTLTGTGNISFAETSRRITGDFSNAIHANRLLFQTSTPNGNTAVGAIPNGTGNSASFVAWNGSNASNGSYVQMVAVAATDARFISGATGTGTLLPMTFYTNGLERLRINSTGDVLATSGALGYGAGAGGTVVQATSKSTTVTLNKPTGQITMNNAALAAGASVSFQVNNTLVLSTDTVVVTAFNNASYRVEAMYVVGGGNFGVRVTNVTGSSLAEALQINFAIIRGATS